MGQFRFLPEYLIEQASRLCHELMFGWEPDIDLAKIKDDMTNSDRGFSFVTHPENNISTAYLELFKRACTSRHEPLSRKDCWNWQAVYKYLKKEESFREYLGLAMYVTGGQLPRWPELLSLWCENGEFGERGLYKYRSSLLYVVRHHKAKRSTNREFIVARFLSAEVARLVYKYCTYIRRFVDLLDRERGFSMQDAEGSSPLLFRAQITSGSKPWQTGRFTAILKDTTSKLWGHPVTSQLLRQLCIGITEKHVREVYQPFNRFVDRSENAHRNVVFAWQSGHRPLQRGTTYGLDGAYPTTLQPQLLELYEWASTKWHEFLHLPSKLSSPATKPPCDVQQLPWLEPGSSTQAPGLRSKSSGHKLQNQDQGDRRPKVSAHPTEYESLDCQSRDSRAISWSPSPPRPKRRRIDDGRTASSLSIPLSRGGSALEIPDPLFGCPNELRSVEEIGERRSILQFLNGYYPTQEIDFRRQDQLSSIVQTVEWWGLVGCQLCFANTGEPEPDHDINTCGKEVDGEKARAILHWLERLTIPLSYTQQRGDCSVCVAFHPCKEMVFGDRAITARSACERAYWDEELEMKSGPDGHCEHKPIIRQVIAALCAYDDQFLGKLFTKLVSDRDGVNLTDECDARKWFEKRISFDDYCFSNILLVYESLVVAFYFRQNQKRGLAALWGFPKQPPGLVPPPKESHKRISRLNDVEELNAWEAALDWWVGECGFCVGRGLRGSHILHELRQCERGGSERIRDALGEAMYEEGILPSNGCDRCHLPYDICDDWMRDEDGEWARPDMSRRQCKYGQYLLGDTLIGLYYCGKGEFQQYIFDEVEEYCDRDCDWEDCEVSYDSETVAYCLSQPITVAGVEGSKMVRMLAVFTRMIWNLVGKD
ncbi:hypothetical protein EDB81DRAFT_671170 [Dactylonectria macrodidyma]|uniref:Uncharacterized protein n=1 Tax=Dactylonectria macrodidyma TaxID=307937 RepID=A0A9P9D224_9HYPO|nr:hypothetical protein EDB81DRAFT_671170 [Dactylonectria macrodidyma]